MNITNITTLRDALVATRKDFDMGSCHYSCDSIGCIGGLAAAIWPEVRSEALSTTWEAFRLADKLDVSYEIIRELTYPSSPLTECPSWPDEATYQDVTKQDAIHTLNVLLTTEAVDWSHVETSRS